MDEIITDAELHQADEWIEGLRVQASIAQMRAPQMILIALALMELKLRRESERMTRSKPQPSSSAARLVDGRTT